MRGAVFNDALILRHFQLLAKCSIFLVPLMFALSGDSTPASEPPTAQAGSASLAELLLRPGVACDLAPAAGAAAASLLEAASMLMRTANASCGNASALAFAFGGETLQQWGLLNSTCAATCALAL